MQREDCRKLFNSHPFLKLKKKIIFVKTTWHTFIFTWASCKVQQESHWNLLSLHKVSVLLKFFRQLVIEVFCSTSMLKSKKSSSLDVTVSQLRHLVSLVKIPWKISLIQVFFLSISDPLAIFFILETFAWHFSALNESISFVHTFKNKIFAYQQLFHWCDWWENWETREHLVACSYQSPLKKRWKG